MTCVFDLFCPHHVDPFSFSLASGPTEQQQLLKETRACALCFQFTASLFYPHLQTSLFDIHPLSRLTAHADWLMQHVVPLSIFCQFWSFFKSGNCVEGRSESSCNPTSPLFPDTSSTQKSTSMTPHPIWKGAVPSPWEYGWDPPNPMLQGIWGFQSISRILPISTAGDASFFRSGSGEGLSELVMEFPGVLRVFLILPWLSLMINLVAHPLHNLMCSITLSHAVYASCFSCWEGRSKEILVRIPRTENWQDRRDGRVN